MVADGSNFCNKCGARLDTDMECPDCHAIIPISSVFCPICGKMVKNDIQSQPSQPARPVQPAQPERPVQPAKPAQNGWQMQEPASATAEDKRRERLEAEAAHKAKVKRNWIIAGISAAVILIIVLLFVRNGNANGSSSLSDSDSVAQLSPDQAKQAFDKTLQTANKTSDGFLTAYALYCKVGSGTEHIVGITFLTSGNQSQYKIYTLNRDGSNWKISNEIQRSVNGAITFDLTELMIDPQDAPLIQQINDKDYFYFAYLNPSTSSDPEATSHVAFCLFDIDNATDVITLDFTGKPNNRNGQKCYDGDFTNASDSPEMQWLQQQALKAKIIYKLSAEEQSLNDPKKAIDKWLGDNATKLRDVRNSSATVRLSVMTYDKPIFEKSTLSENGRVENSKYTFVTDVYGNVFGYSKSTHKYFVAFATSGSSISSVEFNDDGTVHITTDSYNFNLNPSTFEATNGKVSPAKDATKDTQKSSSKKESKESKSKESKSEEGN
jgi:hypothetical protein